MSGRDGKGIGRLGPSRGESEPPTRGRKVVALATGGLALVLGCLGLIAVLHLADGGRRASPEDAAFWSNIGGCGSAGGGAAAGAGKWMGRGATGGLVDLELLSNKTLGGDYLYTTTGLSSVFHLPSLPQWTAGLSLAWKASAFEYEGYKASTDPVPALERQVGGFGDLGFSVSRLFGEANSQSLGLSASLPAGQHDIKRLHQKVAPDDDRRWLSPFVQPGSGLYSLGVTYEFTRDRDWGLFVFGGNYSAAFAWDNWACREGGPSVNAEVLNCQFERPSPLTWKLWELRHQGWYSDPGAWAESEGAPGTGATGGDVASLYAYVGRREELSTQSVGATLNVPLTPTYFWEAGPGSGAGNDSRVSTRVRTNDYTFKLSAGVEISHPGFPVFLSVGIPWRLNDMAERGRLVNPINYIGTLGVKGSFF